jgi:hypothetical protein
MSHAWARLALVALCGLLDCATPPIPRPPTPRPVETARECPPGRGDCDRDPANGCEADLTADADNCHVCGLSCRGAHATEGCFGGVCRVIACEPGYGDCDRRAENGCEARLCHTSHGYECAETCGGYTW